MNVIVKGRYECQYELHCKGKLCSQREETVERDYECHCKMRYMNVSGKGLYECHSKGEI